MTSFTRASILGTKPSHLVFTVSAGARRFGLMSSSMLTSPYRVQTILLPQYLQTKAPASSWGAPQLLQVSVVVIAPTCGPFPLTCAVALANMPPDLLGRTA